MENNSECFSRVANYDWFSGGYQWLTLEKTKGEDVWIDSREL